MSRGLRDSNGQIVINEQEAEADIRKIEQAKSKLEEARKLLDASKFDRERMRGETLDALTDNFSKLNKELNDWETKCTLIVKYIRSIVANYKRIDREYAGRVHGGGGRSF